MAASAVLVALGGCLGTGPASGPAPCPRDPDPEAIRAAAGPAEAARGDPARGAELFETHCAGCHSTDVARRDSRFFRAYPRLDCEAWLAAVSDAYLYAAIADGGEAVNRDAVMKPWAEELSAAAIADLVAYLRSP